jgi:RPA family protein
MPDTPVVIPPAPEPPRVPSGQELFDVIMGNIEPELTSVGAEKAKVTYVAETLEQRKARMQRYELAFERYDQAYEGYMATLHAQVGRYRQASFQNVELKDRSREEGVLDKLSSMFLQAA